MKKILVMADGAVAVRFVKRLIDTYSDSNVYDIVYYQEGLFPKTDAIHCRFYRFDPTSLKKLESIYSREYVAAFIVMENALDVQSAYENLRHLSRELPVSVLDFGGFSLDETDENLQVVQAGELLANRLMALIPNIPVSAQYVGLGQGEIIEAQVPFGSSYAYRHVSNIEQKKWKIAAVYRNRELVLPRPSLMIRPGDNLLLIGQPSILKSVYKAIKIETGQFPAPYGRNLYLLLDISRKRAALAKKELDAALNLHRRIKNKILFIKVINPDSLDLLAALRSIRALDVVVDVAYGAFDVERELSAEVSRLNAGLTLVSAEFFAREENRRLLFKTKRPVLKLGEKSMADLKTASVMLSANPMLENISSAMFDLSAQMALSMVLFSAESDGEESAAIVEHYENLALIHSKRLEIRKSETNPIRALRKEENSLVFLPFEASLIHRSWLDVFKVRQVEKLYGLLDKHYQIFIPVL
ncbi:MAG: COG3400 family protein [Campylobacterales bacterium]